MEYIGDVFYDYGGSLYVNMTNRCPCRCTFCIRDMVDALGDADSLWLKREPSRDELLTMLAEQKSPFMMRLYSLWLRRADRTAGLLVCNLAIL